MPCFMKSDAVFMLFTVVNEAINYFVTFHFEYHYWDGNQLITPLLLCEKAFRGNGSSKVLLQTVNYKKNY